MTAGMPIRLIACLLYMAGGTAATAETRYDRCLTLVQSVNDKLNEQFPERTNTEPSAPAFTPPETDTAVPQFRVAKRVLPYSVITLTYTEHKFASKTPEVRMTKKKVGQYPEFKGFTVKWRDVYADVPESVVKEVDIVLSIPASTLNSEMIEFLFPEVELIDSASLEGTAPEYISEAIDLARQEFLLLFQCFDDESVALVESHERQLKTIREQLERDKERLDELAGAASEYASEFATPLLLVEKIYTGLRNDYNKLANVVKAEEINRIDSLKTN